MGYSCQCNLPLGRQIELVAEFHAYRIRPSRIAYRLGIDIALIDSLLAGERDADRFTAMVKYYRKRRLNQRLSEADRLRGQVAYDQRQAAQRDFDAQAGI
jgi:predicted trehalose synthase